MCTQKSDRSEAATSKRSRVRTCASHTYPCVNYTRFHVGAQAQIRPGTEVFSVGWNMVFVTIGVGCVAKWFMSLLDKLEG